MKRTAGNCKGCLSLEFTKRQFLRNQGAIVRGAGSSLEEGEIVRQSEGGDIDNVAQRLK